MGRSLKKPVYKKPATRGTKKTVRTKKSKSTKKQQNNRKHHSKSSSKRRHSRKGTKKKKKTSTTSRGKKRTKKQKGVQEGGFVTDKKKFLIEELKKYNSKNNIKAKTPYLQNIKIEKHKYFEQLTVTYTDTDDIQNNEVSLIVAEEVNYSDPNNYKDIIPLLNRDKATEKLNNTKNGSYIIRENEKNKYVISLKTNDGIKHTKIDEVAKKFKIFNFNIQEIINKFKKIPLLNQQQKLIKNVLPFILVHRYNFTNNYSVNTIRNEKKFKSHSILDLLNLYGEMKIKNLDKHIRDFTNTFYKKNIKFFVKHGVFDIKVEKEKHEIKDFFMLKLSYQIKGIGIKFIEMIKYYNYSPSEDYFYIYDDDENELHKFKSIGEILFYLIKNKQIYEKQTPNTVLSDIGNPGGTLYNVPFKGNLQEELALTQDFAVPINNNYKTVKGAVAGVGAGSSYSGYVAPAPAPVAAAASSLYSRAVHNNPTEVSTNAYGLHHNPAAAAASASAPAIEMELTVEDMKTLQTSLNNLPYYVNVNAQRIILKNNQYVLVPSNDNKGFILKTNNKGSVIEYLISVKKKQQEQVVGDANSDVYDIGNPLQNKFFLETETEPTLYDEITELIENEVLKTNSNLQPIPGKEIYANPSVNLGLEGVNLTKESTSDTVLDQSLAAATTAYKATKSSYSKNRKQPPNTSKAANTLGEELNELGKGIEFIQNRNLVEAAKKRFNALSYGYVFEKNHTNDTKAKKEEYNIKKIQNAYNDDNELQIYIVNENNDNYIIYYENGKWIEYENI